MKTIFTVLLTLLLGSSLLQAAAFTKTTKHRATKVLISSDKPLTTGTNTFILEIKKNSKTIQNTQVSVKAFMPAMPGMPAMESKTKAKDLGNGKYEVKLNIAMNGTWQIHIFMDPKEGKKSRIKTSINF